MKGMKGIMFDSKYSKVLTVILIVAIIAIIGLLIFMGIDWYKSYTTETGSDDILEQFNAFVNNVQANKDKDNNEHIANNEENVQNNTTNNAPSFNFGGTTQNNQNNTTGGNSSSGSGSSSSDDEEELTYHGIKVVGRIKISKTDIEYPVLADGSAKAIEVAIGMLYGPGINEVGNTVLVGHNFKNGTFFSNNKKLAVGDEIQLTGLDGKKVTYEIYKKYTTDANDFDYATRDTQGKREITLSTCTDDTTGRIIIWAKEK